MKKPGGALRAALRRGISAHPAPYLALRAWRRPGTVIGPGTDLVIEGFPRSANTWSEQVIRLCGPHLHLAHHAHASAHVARAVARGVPALVLVRPPRAAVRSLLAMRGGAAAGPLLADYAAFYEAVARLSGPGLVCAAFRSATQTPERLVAVLEARFGLGLRAYLPGRDEALVRAGMDRAARARRGQRRSGARPDADDTARAARMAAAEAALCAPGAARTLARAEIAHRALACDV